MGWKCLKNFFYFFHFFKKTKKRTLEKFGEEKFLSNILFINTICDRNYFTLDVVVKS